MFPKKSRRFKQTIQCHRRVLSVIAYRESSSTSPKQSSAFKWAVNCDRVMSVFPPLLLKECSKYSQNDCIKHIVNRFCLICMFFLFWELWWLLSSSRALGNFSCTFWYSSWMPLWTSIFVCAVDVESSVHGKGYTLIKAALLYWLISWRNMLIYTSLTLLSNVMQHMSGLSSVSERITMFVSRSFLQHRLSLPR